jgi:hypothetical protein
MKARISQLCKTEAEWDNLFDFVPFKGEAIIFNPDKQYSYARVKIGDGLTKLKDLPFFIDSSIHDFINNHLNNLVIDAGRVTDYKK